MKSLAAMITLALLLIGCVTTTEQYRAYTDAYKVYAQRTPAEQKACELVTEKDVTIPAGFRLTCFASGGGNSLRPPEQIDHRASARVVERALSLGVNAVLGWKAFDSLENILVTGYQNAGHNTTTTQTWGDYSGNGNDGYHLTDRSIRDSYNPTDSYNTDSHDQNWRDDHSVDDHSVDDHSQAGP